MKDTCGGDATLCCGLAKGFIADDTGKATTKAVQNIAMCNKAPTVDGKSQATDWSD